MIYSFRNGHILRRISHCHSVIPLKIVQFFRNGYSSIIYFLTSSSLIKKPLFEFLGHLFAVRQIFCTLVNLCHPVYSFIFRTTLHTCPYTFFLFSFALYVFAGIILRYLFSFIIVYKYLIMLRWIFGIFEAANNTRVRTVTDNSQIIFSIVHFISKKEKISERT